ncbi:hypothetical protein WA556_001087 [Blastocystis sp. ATCC 50177/Nand II]
MSLQSHLERLNAAAASGNREAIKQVVNEAKVKNGCFFSSQFLERCVEIAVQMMPEELENMIEMYKSLCPQDPDRERQLVVEALHLLYLLVSRDLSSFHAELERISDADMENPLIQFSVHIEGYLTTGRYNKIQEYMQLLPHPLFSYLMAGLVESIRDDIESCIEESYRELSVEDFCRTVNWKRRPMETGWCEME